MTSVLILIRMYRTLQLGEDRLEQSQGMYRRNMQQRQHADPTNTHGLRPQRGQPQLVARSGLVIAVAGCGHDGPVWRRGYGRQRPGLHRHHRRRCQRGARRLLALVARPRGGAGLYCPRPSPLSVLSVGGACRPLPSPCRTGGGWAWWVCFPPTVAQLWRRPLPWAMWWGRWKLPPAWTRCLV